MVFWQVVVTVNDRFYHFIVLCFLQIWWMYYGTLLSERNSKKYEVYKIVHNTNLITTYLHKSTLDTFEKNLKYDVKFHLITIFKIRIWFWLHIYV